MVKNSAAGLLTSLDDLFSSQEEREAASMPRVEDISVDLIDDFPDHPFKVRMDGAMVLLVESVGQYGVLEPCLIRPKPDGRYEMVAGHRRKEACIMADRPSIRCIVQEMTDDQAVIIMVDSNLHREEILPSEEAFAYKMKLDAMKQQGVRTDLTSATPLQKSDRKTTRQIIAEEAGESHEQIRKLIRLTYLIPEILEMVDNSVMREKDKLQIALRPAVELSYLTEQEQKDLHETMMTEDRT